MSRPSDHTSSPEPTPPEHAETSAALALRTLVRLLARQAAREALTASSATTDPAIMETEHADQD